MFLYVTQAFQKAQSTRKTLQSYMCLCCFSNYWGSGYAVSLSFFPLGVDIALSYKKQQHYGIQLVASVRRAGCADAII